MWFHDGMFFTTYDNDNDNREYNCGSRWRGGWWYNACHKANLNGEYGNTEFSKGINWYYIHLHCIHLCIQKFNVSICVNVLVFLSCTLKIIRIKFNINFQTHSLYKDYLHSQVIRRTLKNNTFSFTFISFQNMQK